MPYAKGIATSCTLAMRIDLHEGRSLPESAFPNADE